MYRELSDMYMCTAYKIKFPRVIPDAAYETFARN